MNLFFYNQQSKVLSTQIKQLLPQKEGKTKMQEFEPIQIIQNRFYFTISDSTPRNIKNGLCFNTDLDLKYKSFRNDFGPLNIACIHKYTAKIEEILNNQKFLNKIFIHQSSTDYRKHTNAALLVCAAMIILYGYSPQQIWKKFKEIKFKDFRDASEGQCSYNCSILDCLKGLEYSIKLGWYDYRTFDLQQYEHFDQIQNGYLNWIIPGKIAACCAPSNSIPGKHKKSSLSVNEYSKIFRKLGISGVIKLNQQPYEKQIFQEHGLQHYDLPYTDGTPPPRNIVKQFLDITQNQNAYAVHCAAGLGRTGSLIACYAMKHFNFKAAQFIGWIRLCRPGSILGPQQHFVLQIENQMKILGKTSINSKEISQNMSNFWEQLLEQLNQAEKLQYRKMSQDQSKVYINGDKGQGQKLLDLRKSNYESISTVDTDVD